ncbi:hypothetical protein CHGG_03774 [Chaetomium globosum CBS 148.51]|uniref:ATP-dependent DNA helicase n=1 Tax=Chaetomium globosum (strain ATCC 6205 / CBS 148.51 / DSM 1962 / NBRC 6347 / NRRL 1970) TaxID=306901 RepID=Q2H372_CHAGB|nr:uncharacterized protein CHGG_03774 [Chaetomium globosum CBS 148.51]EAQ87155.1 hypothetical protein CHGG_03774 [Chaetomium globosum CBS 148.51]
MSTRSAFGSGSNAFTKYTPIHLDIALLITGKMGPFRQLGALLGRRKAAILAPETTSAPTKRRKGAASKIGAAKRPTTEPASVDHLGRPLSEAALATAREYWNFQRQFDSYSGGDKGTKHSSQPIDLLLQLAQSRRAYTRHVLGVTELESGTRTYEPPYVGPLTVDDLAAIAPSPPAAPEVQLAQPDQASEPVLCPEQLEVVELAANGRNIFYTGSAGCGKSTVLHAAKKRLRSMGKNVQVLAPTGKAALAINGMTTWTYAGWTPGHHKRPLKELEEAVLGCAIQERFEKTDTLIIDEISMVENLHLERLNAVMKSARGDDSPFGGVQVIVTGDFCQLPPVKPFQHCITCGSDLIPTEEEEETIHRCPNCEREYHDSDKWAFRSKAWAECNFVHVHLKSIHRQSDPGFISLLQKCRLGIPFTQDEVDTLMAPRSVGTDAIKLFPTRDEVRRTNEEAFARLKNRPHSYTCLDEFVWNEDEHPYLESKSQTNLDNSLVALNEHRFEPRIEFKIGMLVVLLINLDLSEGLCNGSQGTIIGFERYDEKTPPRSRHRKYIATREEQLQLFVEKQLQDRRKLYWPIVRFINGITRTIEPECEVHELGYHRPYSLLCRTQIPLAAAWAMSVHKSQGMTLDRAVVNLSRAFAQGQVKCSLSRVSIAVVEAEASIYPVRERHAQAAASLWINIHTLPGTHPLAMKKVRTTVRFVSPLQKIARVAEGVRVDRMETIQEYAVPPWVPRLRPTLEADRGKAAEMVNKISGIVIATSSSVKKGIVGMGGLARDTLFNRTSETVTNYAVVLGTREEQNPYTAELAAIAMALEKLPASICHRHITVITRNQSALAAVGRPRQQSSQSIIRQIYDLARLHRQKRNSVTFLWIPAEIDFALGSDAKAAAQRASKQGRTPDSQMPQAKSTAMRLAMERQRATRVLPVGVGKFSKAMDAALPGKHTRDLYDKLKRREACVLAQL